MVNGPPTNFTRTYTTSSAKVDEVILPFEAVDTTSLSMIKILSVNAPRGRTLGAIVSFLSVGVLNTVFGYSLYAGLIYLGANLYLAQLVGRLIGLCFNFYSYQYIALRDRRLDPVRFVLAYAIGDVVPFSSFGFSIRLQTISILLEHFVCSAPRLSISCCSEGLLP